MKERKKVEWIYGFFRTKKTILSLVIAFVVLAAGSTALYLNRDKLGISADTLVDEEQAAETSYVPGQILVKFKAGTTKEKKDKFISDYKLKEKSEISQIGVKVLELPATGTEKEYEKAFKNHKDVEFAELDQYVEPDLIPNDPNFTNQWQLTKISAPAAWDKTTGSSNITIAIVDTGVYANHPDLQGNLVPGWNVYNNNSDTSDVAGHGTMVAGSAAAVINNAVGVAGVCGNCKIMPIRITDLPSGSAPSSAIASGITWAADHGAKVANNSYSAYTNSTVLSAAKYFVSKGGLVTSSSGNSGVLRTVASATDMIVVGATDQSDNIASWSDYGNVVDISAPGVGIYTTTGGSGYSGVSGTSFSAPITAGVLGLIFSANPTLSPAQAESILESTADDFGTAGWDQYFGYGRVNADKAVQAALAGPVPDTTPPVVTITSPAAGSTISGTTTFIINAKDQGGMSSYVTLVTDEAPSIDYLSYQTVSPTEKNFTLAVRTNDMTNGVHTFTAGSFDNAGNRGTKTATFTVSNTLDTIAPTVSITGPLNGAVLSGKSASVLVSATDNVAVSRVEVYIDNVLTKTMTYSPYTFTWSLSKVTTGTHTIYAKAYDDKGNAGTSSAITITKAGTTSGGGGGKGNK